MTADDDVLDLEVLHRVLDDGQRVEVGGNQDVGDVAVDEDVAGVQSENGGLRAARVGTSDPQDLGGLAFTETFEESGISFSNGSAPLRV